MSYDFALSRIASLEQQLGIAPPAADHRSLPSTEPASPTAFTQALTQAQAPSQAPQPSHASGLQTTAGAAAPPGIEQLIQSSAAKYAVDPNIVRAIMRAESSFDPNAGSSAGAQGLMQLMPGTAAGLGVTDINDNAQNVDAGVHYFAMQMETFHGDVRKALAAYNAGPGAVQRYGGVPPYAETQNYVDKITAEVGL